MKNLHLILICLFTAGLGHTQTRVICGFDHYCKEVYKSDSECSQKKKVILSRDEGSRLRGSNDLYTINVVVHLIESDLRPAILDQQVHDVIDVLNEDFRRLNADAGNVRDMFLPVVDDALIEFELAQIIRVSSDSIFAFPRPGVGGLPENVKYTSMGGSDAIDPTRYMNIWVCFIEGGSLLGYAYPPEGLPHWPANANASELALDGVVIHAEAFNRYGNFVLGSATHEVRGRTVTHEVGHYLGLRHIWGDGLGALFGIPNCDDDDGVADTPLQGLPTLSSCDTLLNTCIDSGSMDLPDMIENHMDYASEECKNSFTAGQIMIMRGVLENERYGLIEVSTSNEEIFDDTWITAYPQPTNDALTINNLSDTPLDLKVIDLFGSVIDQLRLGKNANAKIDLANYPSGVFFIRSFDGKTTRSLKILKN